MISNDDDVILMDDLNADEEAAIFEEVEGRYTDHVISEEEVKKKLAAGLIEKIDGFDYYAGRQWIYPIDREIRDYQHSIAHRALFNNTLVVLPTGLGKTLIAAVVMYNIYRWYPQSKIIFMAPTRPLVKQQVDACYHIVGIPKSDIIELTGQTIPSKRKNEWESKRLFFLTPQVVQNDLFMDNCCDPKMIKCIVVDEAHRATGDYAYTKVVQKVYQENKNFRVLALSATPGSNLFKIRAVLKNLLISKIDFRTEESIDVLRYTHSRKIEKVIVKLDNELILYKTRLLLIIEQHLSILKKRKALGDYNLSNLSSYYILKQKQIFEASSTNMSKALVNSIRYTYSLAVSLIYSLELMLYHGLRTFYNHIKSEKNQGKKRGPPNLMAALKNNPILITMMESLQEKFEVDGNVTFRDEDDFNRVTSVPGHPKLVKLQEIILDHFNSNDEDTRVMIFSQYRDSVEEIVSILRQHEPVIKPMVFVGQSNIGRKRFTQKQQLEVVNAFREGKYNTLVATSVAEEGLDIGNVDLIICYDSSKSPVRLVQRIGRTGRKRDGKIVILVTEGREEQSYKESLINKRKVVDNLLSGIQQEDLFKENSRLVPKGLNPTCSKRMLAIKDEDSNNEKITPKIKRVKRKLERSDSIGENTPHSERKRTKPKKNWKSTNIQISEDYDLNFEDNNEQSKEKNEQSEEKNEYIQNSKTRIKVKNKSKISKKLESNNLELSDANCSFFDNVCTNESELTYNSSDTFSSNFNVLDVSTVSKCLNQSEQTSICEEKLKGTDQTLFNKKKYSKSRIKKLKKEVETSKLTNLKRKIQISEDLNVSSLETFKENDDSLNKPETYISEQSLNKNTEYIATMSESFPNKDERKDEKYEKDTKTQKEKFNKSDNADIITKIRNGFKFDLSHNNINVLSEFKPPRINVHTNTQNQNMHIDKNDDLKSNEKLSPKHFIEATKENTELHHLSNEVKESSFEDVENMEFDFHSYMELEDSPDHPNQLEENPTFKYEKNDDNMNSKKQLEDGTDNFIQLDKDLPFQFDDFDDELFMLNDTDYSIYNNLKTDNEELKAPSSSTPNKLMGSKSNDIHHLINNKDKNANKIVFPSKHNFNYKHSAKGTKNNHNARYTFKKRRLDLSVNPFSLSKKKSFPTSDTYCKTTDRVNNHNWEKVTSSSTNKNYDYNKCEKDEICHQFVNEDRNNGANENQDISSFNIKCNCMDNLSSSIRSEPNDLKNQENDEDLFNDEEDEFIANLVLPSEILKGS